MSLFGDKFVGLVEESSAFRVAEDDPFESDILELIEAERGLRVSGYGKRKAKIAANEISPV